MQSLLLLNGSPRGSRSNSMKMLAHVAEGWANVTATSPQPLHLANRADFDRAVEAFAQAEVVLLGFPLYTDSMPALVMEWMEAIARKLPADRVQPTLGFLVQSGFPEACHMRPLERYLQKLAGRLGSAYAGTIVRGGGESLQSMPDQASKKLWANLRLLGEELAREGSFRPATLRRIATIERFSRATALLLSLATHLPIAQFYWNGMLKKNGAWKQRFDAPFGAAAPMRFFDRF